VKYLKEKYWKLKETTKRKMFSLTDVSSSNSSGEGEVIAQLVGKFHTMGKKSEKVQMLMVLPQLAR
jgi:hypothetical protein